MGINNAITWDMVISDAKFWGEKPDYIYKVINDHRNKVFWQNTPPTNFVLGCLIEDRLKKDKSVYAAIMYVIRNYGALHDPKYKTIKIGFTKAERYKKKNVVDIQLVHKAVSNKYNRIKLHHSWKEYKRLWPKILRSKEMRKILKGSNIKK